MLLADDGLLDPTVWHAKHKLGVLSRRCRCEPARCSVRNSHESATDTQRHLGRASVCARVGQLLSYVLHISHLR